MAKKEKDLNKSRLDVKEMEKKEYKKMMPKKKKK